MVWAHLAWKLKNYSEKLASVTFKVKWIPGLIKNFRKLLWVVPDNCLDQQTNKQTDKKQQILGNKEISENRKICYNDKLVVSSLSTKI